MDAYTDFAQVYDTFMDDTPYEAWRDIVTDTLDRYGIRDGLVLDLGCGTGTMTELLSVQGYDMIGVDNAQEMLNQAITKRDESGNDILYLCQDMREFELYGTVRAVISLCDSINYITDNEELRTVFSLVNNYLDPDGIFFFDFNTDYKYREIIGDTVIAENREDCSFIWENYYHEDVCINEYDITIFVAQDKNAQAVTALENGTQGNGEQAVTVQESGAQEKDVLYRKFTETHYQKGYKLDEIKDLLEEAGLIFLEAKDADTLGEVTAESERIYVTARESGKVRKQDE